MADNYLERKYEEYKSKKSSPSKSGQSAKKGSSFHKMRRVFVTGGADGIGKAIVRAFRMAGNRVAFCDNNEALGKETAEKTGTTFFPVDISNKEALVNCMQQMLEEWGDLDIIINIAGIDEPSSPAETLADDFERILSANLRPAFITSRLLALHRRSQSTPNLYGRIINISSPVNPTSKCGNEIYMVAKDGLHSLTHAFSTSLAPLQITVNSITPGRIPPHNNEQLHPDDPDRQPSLRTGKPEDIARICLFLCQEENDFINGENICIDGGWTTKC